MFQQATPGNNRLLQENARALAKVQLKHKKAGRDCSLPAKVKVLYKHLNDY
jgi:hypothetical protein